MSKKGNDKQKREERQRAYWQNRPAPPTPEQQRAKAAEYASQYRFDARDNPPQALADVQPLLQQFNYLVLARDYAAAFALLNQEIVAGDTPTSSLADFLAEYGAYSQLEGMIKPLLGRESGLEPAEQEGLQTLLSTAVAAQLEQPPRHRLAAPQLGSSSSSATVGQPRLQAAAALLLQAEQSTDLEERMKVLGEIDSGRSFDNFSYPDGTLPFMERTLALARKESTQAGVVQAATYLAIYHSRQHNYPEAIRLAEETIQLDMERGERVDVTEDFMFLRELYGETKDYTQIVAATQRELAYARTSDDANNQFWPLVAMADAYFALGRYQESIAAQEQALLLDDKIDVDMLAELNSGIAISYARLGDVEQAIAYRKRAVAVYEEEGDQRKLYTELIHLARLYERSGQEQQGKETRTRIAEAIKLIKRRLPQHRFTKVEDE